MDDKFHKKFSVKGSIYLGGPAVEHVDDDAVGLPLDQELPERLLEGRRVCEGGSGHVGVRRGGILRQLEGVNLDGAAGPLVPSDGAQEGGGGGRRGEDGGGGTVGGEDAGDVDHGDLVAAPDEREEEHLHRRERD